MTVSRFLLLHLRKEPPPIHLEIQMGRRISDFIRQFGMCSSIMLLKAFPKNWQDMHIRRIYASQSTHRTQDDHRLAGIRHLNGGTRK